MEKLIKAKTIKDNSEIFYLLIIKDYPTKIFIEVLIRRHVLHLLVIPQLELKRINIWKKNV